MPSPRTLPTGLSPDELAAAYRRELERHTALLVTELRDVISDPPAPGEIGATVEVFPDEQGTGRVSIGMYFQGMSRPLDDTDASLGGSRHLALAGSVRDMPRIDVTSYGRYLSVADLTVDQIKAWFADCWNKAGGDDYPLRVELIGHEDFGDGEILLLSEGR